MSFKPIRFCPAPGVSFGGTEAQAREDHVAVFFTIRPIAPGEKLTLTINDKAMRCEVKIGFTENEPETLREKLPEVLPCGLDENTGIRGPGEGDAGCVKGNTVTYIYYEETTDSILIDERDFGWREIITGFRVRRPVFVVFNIVWGTPRICITSRMDPGLRSKPIHIRLRPLSYGGSTLMDRERDRVRSEGTDLPRAAGTRSTPSGMSRRGDSSLHPAPPNLRTLQTFLEGQSQMVDITGPNPIYPGAFFYPGESAAFINFLLQPARITFSGSSRVDSWPNRPTADEILPRRENFVFIDTPLRANRALIVKLMALKRARPIQIVLTVESADRVYSCGSLLELCNTTYSIRMESEIPQVGDELAVRISPSGAVHISHNNRGWVERMHVDPQLKYHVVFDMEHVDRLSMIGITNGLGEIGEDASSVPSTPPGGRPECVACRVESVNVVIISCGHLVLCEGCAIRLMQADQPRCPCCRTTMTNFMKVYYG